MIISNHENFDKIFIIGGGEIFKQAIKFADEMIISIMNFDAEGDIYFPDFNKAKWEIVKTDKRDEFEILYYNRR